MGLIKEWKKLVNRRESAVGAADSPESAASGGATDGKAESTTETEKRGDVDGGVETDKKLLELPEIGNPEGEDDYSRSQLIHIKGWVYEQEKGNRDKLFIFRTPSIGSSIRWWKVGGASAVILVNAIWPMLGRRNEETRNDGDKYYEFREGVRSIRSIEDFTDDMDKVGVVPIASSDVIIVFQLRRPIEEKKYKEYRQKSGLYIKRAHDTLEVVYKFPELEAHLRDLGRTLINQGRMDDAVIRELFTADYTKMGMRPYRILREVCIGRKELKVGFGDLAMIMDYLGENVYLLAEYRIRSERQILAIQRDLVPAREEILLRLKEYEGDKNV